MNINIPNGAQKIIDRLKQNGYASYLVGGCVRDALMSRKINDWDITTAAHPKTVCEIFSDMRVVESGITHGTVTVIINSEQFEVTTFRADGDYLDHRHPDKVLFTSIIEDDLARRDFTINAMAYNSCCGLIDIYGGTQDIENKTIKAVGDAKKRFTEDALRILRGLRFASQLGFNIDENTKNAMFDCKNMLMHISGERIFEELSKLIMGDYAKNVLSDYAAVITCAIPAISESIGFDQRNKHHIYDVWEHTLYALSNTPPDLICKWAVFLHDLGKPSSFSLDDNGTGHFYGHALRSSQIASDFFENCGVSNTFKNRVCRLISLHDSDVFNSDKSIKRWLGKLGEEDLLRLIKIKKADNMAQAPQYRGRIKDLELVINRISDIVNQKPCVDKAGLAVNGNDIIACGFVGKQIGIVLDELLDAVIDSRCDNTKHALINYIYDNIQRDC